jgi:hypothetical protein
VLALSSTSAEALTWRAPQEFPGSCFELCTDRFEPPVVAVNAAGDAAIAQPTDDDIDISIAAKAGRFARPVNVPTVRGDHYPDDLRLAITTNGTTIAAWTGSLGEDRTGSDEWVVRYALHPRGGTFGKPVTIGTKHRMRFSPQLAAQPDGTTLLTYAGGRNLYAQTISPGGRPGAARVISSTLDDDDDGSELALKTAPDGTTVLCCWQRASATRLAIKPPARPWKTASVPLDAHDELSAFAAANGRALLGVGRLTGAVGHRRLTEPALLGVSATGVTRTALAVGPAYDVEIDALAEGAAGETVVGYTSATKDGATTVGATTRNADGTLTTQPLGSGKDVVLAPWQDGVLAAWADGTHHWRVATAAHGAFTSTSAPGTPVGDHALVTAGGYAAVAWYRGGLNRVVGTIGRP